MMRILLSMESVDCAMDTYFVSWSSSRRPLSSGSMNYCYNAFMSVSMKLLWNMSETMCCFRPRIDISMLTEVCSWKLFYNMCLVTLVFEISQVPP